MELHPGPFQRVPQVPGTEQRLGHIQIEEMNGVRSGRQTAGQIHRQLAFAASRLPQEDEIPLAFRQGINHDRASREGQVRNRTAVP